MVSKFCIQIEQQEIEVQVNASKRRSMALEIRSDGSVVVRIPNRTPQWMVKRFVAGHARWIYEKRTKIMEKKPCEEVYTFPEWESLPAAERKKAKEKIVARVEHFAEVMGLTYGSVSMRNQKSRWGSCSSKGNLNFNYRLAYLPEELLDYVVVHELAHRRHMDHSKDFWNEVNTYYPNYKNCKKQLNEIRIN